jgi:hypothetical protein
LKPEDITGLAVRARSTSAASPQLAASLLNAIRAGSFIKPQHRHRILHRVALGTGLIYVPAQVAE